MIKAHIVDRLYDKLKRRQVSKTEASDLVDTVFDIIKKTLVSGEDVKITGFGIFKVVDKKEREGRNPKTGGVLTISARRVVRFKASNVLRTVVSESQ